MVEDQAVRTPLNAVPGTSAIRARHNADALSRMLGCLKGLEFLCPGRCPALLGVPLEPRGPRGLEGLGSGDTILNYCGASCAYKSDPRACHIDSS